MSNQARDVIVTGAASGIGKGICRAFANEGDRVWMVDFREETLRAACDELSKGDASVRYITADLREPGDIMRIVKTVLQDSDGIDVLVNNAGVYPNRLAVEMALEEWDSVMHTNLRAPFLLGREVAKTMISRGMGGKIINIGSGAAFSGRAGAAHYCSSKAGLLMLTKVLALELAQHQINVNTVSPGLTEVKSEVNPLSAEYLEILTKNIPMGRIGQPEDIAPTVVFLASSAADFITGAEISVNGGITAGRAFLPLSG